MRLISRVLCPTAVVVAMTACGGSATTTPTTQSHPATHPTRALFPVTIMRTGGIAGFRDVLVVAGDDLVSVTRKGQKPQQCRLTPGAVWRLTTAASQVPWARVTPADTRPSFPDDLVTTVRSPAGGPFRLEDPQVGAGRHVFLELLGDLSGGPAASRRCTPV